jgi:hypothetical protein
MRNIAQNKSVQILTLQTITMNSISRLLLLPSVPLKNRAKLPGESAIYFTIDQESRVLYIGKAKNLNERWKNHHRTYALEQLDNTCSVFIYWQSCAEGDLDEAEKILIQQFQPLLNDTKVETEPVIPSEIVLQDFLRTFSRRLIISGIKPKGNDNLAQVYLHYDCTDASARGTSAKIRDYIKKNQGKNTSLKFKHHKYGRFEQFASYALRPGSRERKVAARQFRACSNHWEFRCNGVIFHALPIMGYRNYSQTANSVKLAKIKCKAVSEEAFLMAQKRGLYPFSELTCFTVDLVPMLWPHLK